MTTSNVEALASALAGDPVPAAPAPQESAAPAAPPVQESIEPTQGPEGNAEPHPQSFKAKVIAEHKEAQERQAEQKAADRIEAEELASRAPSYGKPAAATAATEDAPAGEAAESDDDKAARAARHPVDVPGLGRVYMTVEQMRSALANKAAAQAPKPQASPHEKAISDLRAEIQSVEESGLTNIEKDARLARLEARLARAEASEDRAKLQTIEKQRSAEAQSKHVLDEVNARLAKHADVFDEKKAYADLSKAARSELIEQAREIARAMMVDPRNNDKSEVEIIDMAANRMRALAKNLGVAKRDIVRDYVSSKRATKSPAPPPSVKGGGTPKSIQPPRNGEMRGGRGRELLLEALGGPQ